MLVQLRILSTFVILILGTTICKCQENNSEGILFLDKPFSEIKALAKEQNKLIFVDAYTTWCGPCKRMSKEIFPLKNVAEFYNSNFICTKIDMEKGEGLDIAKQYAVRNYPTYLFISCDGELIHRSLGSKPADEFIQDGKNALTPNLQLIGKIKYARANSENEKIVDDLFIMMDELAISPDSIVLKSFIDQVKAEQIINPLTFKIINKYGVGLDTKAYKFQKDNYAKLVSVYSKDTINTAFKDYIHRNLDIYAKRGNKEEYQKFKTEMTELKEVKLDDEKIWLTDINYYKLWKDLPALEKTYLNGTEKYCWDDANKLNSIAWTLFEKSSDKKVLLKADKYILRCLELDENGSYLDTRANILFKLGNKSEAKMVAEKAILLLKKEGQDSSDTEDLLKKINSNN